MTQCVSIEERVVRIDGHMPVESGTLAEKAEFIASRSYECGYHCGESVVRAINEVAGTPLPPEVMRMASGFCEGLGGSGCICGALAGSVMAAGLLAGRQDAGDRWEPSYDAASELRARWVDDQGVERCDQVVARIGDMGDPARWAHCTTLVGRCAHWVVEIAQREGWIPAHS